MNEIRVNICYNRIKIILNKEIKIEKR